MEEKMLKFSLLIRSTSQPWHRHSFFIFAFFFPSQGSIKLLFYWVCIGSPLYTELSIWCKWEE